MLKPQNNVYITSPFYIDTFKVQRKVILSLIIVFYSINGLAQSGQPDISNISKLVEVIPPAPNAAALGKYGGIDASLSSGMPNISIPIFSYQSSNLTLPMSLNYSSNGLRVDEIASRTGTSWNLNAGGVITRTVYGNIDESSERMAPPQGFPARTKATLDYLKTFADDPADHFDSEQDLFSFNFNGYTGKFILDDNMDPIQLTHSNLKIEKDFNSTVWNFRITTGDGIQYFFGGNAKESTSKSQTGTGCGKIYRNPANTAWYLNKIVHPNKDTISFSYTSVSMVYNTGISQSFFYKVSNLSGCTTCPTYQNTTCVGSLLTSGVLLKEITSSGGARIKFLYTGRLDLDDSLLSRIEIYKPDNIIARVFDLEYIQASAVGYSNAYQVGSQLFYRPFLTKFIERSADSTQVKAFQFYYNDLNNLPPRLAFAQDHYGYFNGKNNNTLLTWSKDDWLMDYIPQANANREPDPEYCSKGMLTKIVYPTGGEDTLIYEGNMIYGQVQIPSPTGSLVANARSIDLPGGAEIGNSDTVLIEQNQHVTIFGSASSTGDDPIHNRGVVSVIELPGNTVIFSQTVSPTQSASASIPLRQGYSYFIQVRAAGEELRTSASFQYLAGPVVYVYQNNPTAGIRIKKVISKSKFSPETVKRYYYNTLADTTRSSATNIFTPTYFKMLTNKIGCNPSLCSYTTCQYYVLYSNTQNNIYIYNASPVEYRAVIEGTGENFEGGGTEHTYTVANDMPGNSLMGDNISSAPFTSYSWRNGREIHQFTFKRNGATNVPVHETFTHFKEDSRVDSTFTAYVVNKKYGTICQGDPPSEDEINAFDLLAYSHLRKWSYVDSVKTRVYDTQGLSYVEELSVTAYANASHAMPTSITTTSSDNKIEATKNYYPDDLTLSGSEETARQRLLTQNMVTPVLLQQFVKNNTTTAQLKTGYVITPENLVLPQTQNMQIGSNAMEKRVELYKYNTAGKLLEQSKSNDVHEVFLWGYKNMYPVAKITGSDYSTVSSFISNMNILNNPSSDQQLRDELNRIRTGLAATSAMVVTYTYSPLLGITSETDANGRTTYYEYDTLGRLKLVKNQDGKILKQYDYQFQKPVTQ